MYEEVDLCGKTKKNPENITYKNLIAANSEFHQSVWRKSPLRNLVFGHKNLEFGKHLQKDIFQIHRLHISSNIMCHC